MKITKRELINAIGQYTAMSFDEIENMISFLPETINVRLEESPKIELLDIKEKRTGEIINKINEIIRCL